MCTTSGPNQGRHSGSLLIGRFADAADVVLPGHGGLVKAQNQGRVFTQLYGQNGLY